MSTSLNHFIKPCGFVYVATGEKYKKEAAASCKSLRTQMADVHVTIFSDSADHMEAVFDDVVIVPKPTFGFADKIFGFRNSPYERTIFLDTDTFIVNPLYELFEVLDRFDIAAVRDHWQVNPEDCPMCFDDFNTGVVCFKNTPDVQRAFTDWESIHFAQLSSDPAVGDQAAFRSAVYQNRLLQIYVLPKTYNVRLPFPVFFGVNHTPKILHGRPKDFRRVSEILISSSSDFRLFIPNGSFVASTQIEVMEKQHRILFQPGFSMVRGFALAVRSVKRLVQGRVLGSIDIKRARSTLRRWR